MFVLGFIRFSNVAAMSGLLFLFFMIDLIQADLIKMKFACARL
jgi:hypothetical protein